VKHTDDTMPRQLGLLYYLADLCCKNDNSKIYGSKTLLFYF